MTKKLLLYFLIILLGARPLFALTIDTNQLMNLSYVTNINVLYTEETKKPNLYLKVGSEAEIKKLVLEPPETPARRFDIIFFVSIPITFYLTLNIMQIKNRILGPYDPALSNITAGYLDTVDWNYVYVNTLVIPLFVAYQDYIFVENRKAIDQQYSSVSSDFNVGMTIFRTKF